MKRCAYLASDERCQTQVHGTVHVVTERVHWFEIIYHYILLFVAANAIRIIYATFR